MKTAPFFLALFLASSSVSAAGSFEILAIGDSQTNGKGVEPGGSYPEQLESLLRADGLDVAVRNSGIDGNGSFDIYDRLIHGEVTDKTRIVILQESTNDSVASIEYTEKSLAWLEDHHLPAILISNRRVQSDDEARLMAERHGAVYYGSLFRAVPKDADHVQMGEWQMKKGGQTDNHMTAKGYGVLAKLMRKSVKTVIEANHLD